jgi:hypothetical protein
VLLIDHFRAIGAGRSVRLRARFDQGVTRVALFHVGIPAGESGFAMVREDEIRVIAYALWEQDGRPQGLALDSWLKAEAIWDLERSARNGTRTKTSSEDIPNPGSRRPSGHSKSRIFKH